MKKMKWLFSVLAVALIGAIGLSACGGGAEVGSLSNVGNESFEGCISTETYTSAEEAAKGFLKEEIDGGMTSAKYVSYEKTGELTSSDIEALSLGDLTAADITSAEIGTITFNLSTKNSSLASAPASGQDSTRTQTVYLLGLSDGAYRYFVPAARNGEMLTKSYYEDMWNPEHYLNCTISMNMTYEFNMSVSGQTAKVLLDLSFESKTTKTSMWAKIGMNVRAEGEGAEQMEDLLEALAASATEMYALEADGSLYSCVKSGEDWIVEPMPGVTFYELMMERNASQPEFLDYSYFEKTDSGFAIAPEKFELYCENFIGGLGLGTASASATADGEATYFVKDKRLEKATVRIGLSMGAQNGTQISYAASVECNYKDYGTTTVEIPAEVQAKVDAFRGAAE